MLKELLEKRASIVSKMEAVAQAAVDEDRDLTEDEQAQYDQLKADKKRLDNQCAMAEDIAVAREEETRLRPAAGAAVAPLDVANHPGRNAPEARTEFESVGEFMAAVAYNPNDQRLANLYQERAADQSMGSGPRGGFAVPTQFLDRMLHVSPQEAIIRPRAEVLPAGSPPDAAVTMPALDQTKGAAPANTYGGVTVGWVGEGGAKPKTDVALREITLQPKEVAGHIAITDKLLRNWQSAGAMLERQLRGAIISSEEHAFFNGNGVGKPLGFAASGAAYKVTRNTAGSIITEDIDAMAERILMRGGSPIWMASQSVKSKLRQLKDEEGNRIWQSSLKEGDPDLLDGKPVFWHERSPLLGTEGDLVLADLSYYLIKDGSGPFVAMGHINDDFTNNKSRMKIFWNVDGQPWLTAPFKQEKGFEVSPFVVLK